MCFGGKHETQRLSGNVKPSQLRLGGDQFIINSFMGFDDGDGDYEEENNFDDIHQLELELKKERQMLEKAKMEKEKQYAGLNAVEGKLNSAMKQDLISMIHIELEKAVLIDELLDYEKMSQKYMGNG